MDDTTPVRGLLLVEGLLSMPNTGAGVPMGLDGWETESPVP